MLELIIWILRLAMMGVLLLLVLALMLTLRADLRAAGDPAAAAAPEPKPETPRTPAPGRRVRTLAYQAGPLPTTGREFPLVGTLTIGRDPGCQIVIPSPTVSKQHARLYAQAGDWFVEDTGSTNGTLLNDEPLLAPTRVTPGDRLSVGDTRFALR
ncbi:MAG TPA: FHA domain-containing protein [Armatimonadota bacterium]|nr:FHA domain-containing protein [Armatimonadota bacterium]HOS42903.1 FHA domain-containing protein [Armatimonadota bacterium]